MEGWEEKTTVAFGLLWVKPQAFIDPETNRPDQRVDNSFIQKRLGDSRDGNIYGKGWSGPGASGSFELSFFQRAHARCLPLF